MPPKPPPADDPVKGGLERFGFYGTRWAAGLIIGSVLFVSVQGDRPAKPLPPPPPVDGALPLQQWAVDSAPNVLASVLMGALPRPDPRQRKPPCDPDLEREFQGYCWVALKVPPPCPKGKAWEEDGACYAFALNPARLPSSGSIPPSNVAGDPR